MLLYTINKIKKLAALSVLSLGAVGYANAQCSVNIVPSTDTISCGGTVDLDAQGSGGTFGVLVTDFDNQTPGNGWAVSPAADFTNPCGPGPNGFHMWMGSTTAAPRELISYPLDLSCGADICFELRFAEQGDPSPCEGPDLTNEGVYLEWSINNGTTWNTVFYFEPNSTGSLNAACNGCGDYTAWTNYCFTLPPGAWSPATQIRFWQDGSSGNGFDHWGIDNVQVLAVNCASYYYDWAHIPGSPDTNLITENLGTTTSYDVLYTNGIDDTCYASITIVVDTLMNAEFNYNSPVCQGDSIALPNFSAGIAGVFTSTNGLILDSLTGEIDLLGSTPGTYTVQNFVAALPGCVADTHWVDITINPEDDPGFTYSDTIYCQDGGNQLPNITGMMGGTFFESSGNLSINTATGEINAAGSFDGGPYTVEYTTNGPCPQTATFDVYIEATDDPTFNYTSQTYCTNDANQLPIVTGETGGSWASSSPDLVIDGATGEITVSSSIIGGPYTVTYTTPGICPASQTFDITILPMDDASFNYPAAVYCESDVNPSPSISGLSGGVFSESSGNVTVDPLTGVISLPLSNVGGPYTIEYTTTGPCPSTETFEVTIEPTPAAPVVGNQTGCAGESYTFNATGGSGTFNWYSDAGGTDLVHTGSSISIADTLLPGNYTWYVSETLGNCVGPLTPVTLTLTGPVAFFVPTPDSGEVPLDVDFADFSTGGTNWLWDFGDGATSSAVNPSHTYEEFGTYTVTLTVTDAQGCASTYIYTFIQVGGPSSILVPNVFSPDGNGVNDIFYVTYENIASFTCEIYNRWGTKIYEYDNINDGWDGITKGGNAAPDGTYYYIIKATGSDDLVHEHAGSFQLVR